MAFIPGNQFCDVVPHCPERRLLFLSHFFVPRPYHISDFHGVNANAHFTQSWTPAEAQGSTARQKSPVLRARSVARSMTRMCQLQHLLHNWKGLAEARPNSDLVWAQAPQLFRSFDRKRLILHKWKKKKTRQIYFLSTTGDCAFIIVHPKTPRNR